MPGFEESYRFRTEVIESYRGNEQRIAQRVRPRRRYQYTGHILGDELSSTLVDLTANPGEIFFIPHFEKPSRLSGLSDKGAQQITVEDIPPWLSPGRAAYIGGNSAEDIYTISAVEGKTVGILQPLRRAYVEGEGVLRAAPVRRLDRFQGSFRTSIILEPEFELEEDPVRAWHREYPEKPPVMHEGLEYFGLAPNWSTPIRLTAGSRWDDLDLNRGAVERLFPVPFPTRLFRMEFLLHTEDRLDQLLGLFYRSRGRQKSWYSPSHLLELKVVSISSLNSIVIEGPEVHEFFRDSTVYRRVRIRFQGVDHLSLVQGVSLVAGNTALELQSPLPSLPNGAKVSCSWVTRCRFETDVLTLDWRTTSVAVVRTTIRSLEDI